MVSLGCRDAHASLLLQLSVVPLKGQPSVCLARRGQLHGRGNGSTRSSSQLSAPRRWPSWQPESNSSRARRCSLTAPARRKSRPWASSQVSRGLSYASDECASGDPALVPDVEANQNESRLTRFMLSSEQEGWPAGPGPRACRRHGARRLIICAARTGRSLTARARRRLSGGKL